MADLHVYCFSPAWGLPSSGPFALKLLAWLGLHRIPHEKRIENRSSRGPLGKSPWIEREGQRLGDSDAIIRLLAQENGLPDPTRPRDPAEARALAIKTAFEERFHQVLEWELFVHPAGAEGMRALLRDIAPAPLAPLLLARLRRHFARQLRARGIGRLAPHDIAAEGGRMLDILDAVLTDDAWLHPGGPGLADLAVWGQVAPLLNWPMATPVAQDARRRPRLNRWAASVAQRSLGHPWPAALGPPPAP